MTEFTVNTDEANEDLGQAIREAETNELIDLYRHLEPKTLFQYVADELDYRRQMIGELESLDQQDEIDDLLR